MRLRSIPVSKKEKDDNLRNKVRGKKKHKRLDAICEQAFSRNQRRDQKVELSEFINGDNDIELRRSKRCRKTPVLLDSSPLPPKKRQRVFKSVSNISEKDRGRSDVLNETQPSCSRDFNGQDSSWQLRLRSRGKSRYSSKKDEGQFTERGKRKLFTNYNGFGGFIVTDDDNKKELTIDKSAIVKSKRPGRIKASNVVTNGDKDSDVGGDIECVDEKNLDVVLEKNYIVNGRHVEHEIGYISDVGREADNAMPNLTEKEVDTVQIVSVAQGCHINGDAEEHKGCIGGKNVEVSPVHDHVNTAEVDHDMANKEKYFECLAKPIEEAATEIPDGKCNKPAVLDGENRISLGRRCGLCGGGNDGKPPNVLILEGACSDNEEYRVSSESEEPNYDMWDGFGDQPNWLGRLLGPINDRFGIAGIWVHQQCAVWSPEVYFSGLGCLKNIRAALYRGRMLKCSRCGRAGATIGCRVDRCPKTYHLPCARDRGCIFYHRKFLIACNDHRQLFQPQGVQNVHWLQKMKTKKLKLELLKDTNNASRKDVEAEEKFLENCGEDEEFLKRESKRLHRDLLRIAPTYIGGCKPEDENQFQGWESIAGLKDVIQCMKEVVILPLLYPEFFSNLGIVPPRGVLLHGHPGTGKTLVLRSLIGSCARGDTRIAYFARKGADCLGKYVGDAERQLRLLFQVAEKSQPSIIFFDEIDGLAPCRTKKQDQTHNSVVSTLLALMDGLKSRGSVIVIGTTNRPDSVDPALRRPGRFDREIYFPLPSVKDREAILSLHTQKWHRPITGFLLKWVAKQTVGFAGADLQALCTQTFIIALKRSFPLREILSEAETGVKNAKRLEIPTFFVVEEDWLKALSCSPPPCSKREAGITLNDVATSPLKIHLFSCLLLPLARLLICLQLDDNLCLPQHLDRASSLVKNAIVSTLDRRKEYSDRWWLHVDGLLHETDVMKDIERKLLLETALVEESGICESDMIQAETDDINLRMISPTSQFMGTQQGLLQNMSYQSCKRSGFHLMICGNPKSGQRHLASCLLHCFAGNLDFIKIDLASIFLEGHGDTVHGLTRSLMRCAGSNFCLLYMPRLDLWAVEDVVMVSDFDPALSFLEKLDSSLGICRVAQSELDVESELCSTSASEGTEETRPQSARKEVSYLWISFLEQVESICVNTSLIILATSDLPFESLPNRVREFFGNEIMNSSISNSLPKALPWFSVQLDGNFDRDHVINSFAAKLSKDLVQHFIHSYHVENHMHKKPSDWKVLLHSDGNSVCCTKFPKTSQSGPSSFGNKALKGKTSLQIAISTFGYQILTFPHFAELCWVTSKLKQGPSAKTDAYWKGWPFHSCIIRPIPSTDQNVATSCLSNIKSKEPGSVHGLVAVGLSAYRGEYTSLRKVCCEVRNVLETLVARIDEKIHAGKDQLRFFRILSQVAYLDDMVTGLAHAFERIDVDNHASEANAIGPSSFNDQIGNEGLSNGHGEGQTPDALEINSISKLTSEKNIPEVQVRYEPFLEPSNVDISFKDVGDEVDVTLIEPTHHDAIHGSSEHIVHAKLSNGFTESNSYSQPDGPATVSHYSANIDHSLEKNGITSEESSQDLNSSTCFFKCCSECFANLHELLLRIIDSDCGHNIRSSSTSTIEDLHDILSAFSANLHLSLSKLPQGGDIPSKSCSRYGNSSKMMINECFCCHETASNVSSAQQFGHCHSPGFVFNNGVVSCSLDSGNSNISYHCKFEKVCLCYLIEWLQMRKK